MLRANTALALSRNPESTKPPLRNPESTKLPLNKYGAQLRALARRPALLLWIAKWGQSQRPLGEARTETSDEIPEGGEREREREYIYIYIEREREIYI